MVSSSSSSGSSGVNPTTSSSSSSSSSSSAAGKPQNIKVSKTIKDIVKGTHFEVSDRPHLRHIYGAKLFGKITDSQKQELRTQRDAAVNAEEASKKEDKNYEQYLAAHESYYDTTNIVGLQTILKTVRDQKTKFSDNANVKTIRDWVKVTGGRRVLIKAGAPVSMGHFVKDLPREKQNPVSAKHELEKYLCQHLDRDQYNEIREVLVSLRKAMDSIDFKRSLFALDLACKEVPEILEVFFTGMTDSSHISKEQLEALKLIVSMGRLEAYREPFIPITSFSSTSHVSSDKGKEPADEKTITRTQRPLPTPKAKASTAPVARPLPTPKRSPKPPSDMTVQNRNEGIGKSGYTKNLEAKYESFCTDYNTRLESYLNEAYAKEYVEKLKLGSFIDELLKGKDRLDAYDFRKIHDKISTLDEDIQSELYKIFSDLAVSLQAEDSNVPLNTKIYMMLGLDPRGTDQISLTFYPVGPDRGRPTDIEGYSGMAQFFMNIDKIRNI